MTDLGNGLFAVGVPEDAEKIELTNYGLLWEIGADWDSLHFMQDVNSNFKILGTVTKDNIDFDVDTYVECENGRFKNYQTKDAFIVLTSELSFRSLLASKELYFENPYGDPPHNIGLLHTYATGHSLMDASFKPAIKWQQAQNNLIEKLVIIKKV